MIVPSLNFKFLIKQKRKFKWVSLSFFSQTGTYSLTALVYHIVVFTRATAADSWHIVDGASVTMVDAAQPQPTPTPTPTTTVTVTATPTPAPVAHVPQTGDSTPLLAMVIATAAAAAGFIALLVARRRKNRLEEENDPQLEPREDWEDRHE